MATGASHGYFWLEPELLAIKHCGGVRLPLAVQAIHSWNNRSTQVRLRVTLGQCKDTATCLTLGHEIAEKKELVSCPHKSQIHKSKKRINRFVSRNHADV